MKFLLTKFIFFNILLVAVYSASMFDLGNSMFKRLMSSGSPDIENIDVVNCFGADMDWNWTVDNEFRKSLDRDNMKVHFFLASQKRPVRVFSAVGDVGSVSDFKISKPTVIIIHGFMSHSDQDWVVEMEKAFLKYGDVNVIIVDWSEGSRTFNYMTAAKNIRHVAYKLSKFMAGIVQDKKLQKVPIGVKSWGPVHCIGHSLGAHVCGLTAKMIKINSDIPRYWRIRRITGLDPAQPCFEHPDIKLKLMKEDAPFVDIIHTNMQLHKKLGLGLPEAIGHMDFYPNGGHLQPGCGSSKSMMSKFFNFAGIPWNQLSEAICSHGRAYIYFTESITSSRKRKYIFPSSPWNRTLEHAELILNSKPCTPYTSRGCVEMGIDSVYYNDKGTFFTYTAQNPPYNDVDYEDKAVVKELLENIGSFLEQR